MQLTLLQDNLHRQVNLLRSIERIIFSKSFIRLYENASEYSRKEVDRYIHSSNKVDIEKWICIQETKELGEKSVRELRAIAQTLGVPNYHLLPKSSLLSEIENARQNKTVV